MSLDWRGWTYLTIIIVSVFGFGGYGMVAHKPWAITVGVVIAFAFVYFVLWLANVMNTDI